MNPVFKSAVCLTAIAGVSVAAYDDKVRTPPAGPLGALLTANSTSTITMNSIYIVDTLGLRNFYDTTAGRKATTDHEGGITL